MQVETARRDVHRECEHGPHSDQNDAHPNSHSCVSFRLEHRGDVASVQGKNVGRAHSDTALAELEERRAFLCRLTPDRALETLDEAEEFLRERGMLTRTTDSSLPSLFEACHEEPYAPDKPGFGQWPRTKWGWSFALAQRPGGYAPKIHPRAEDALRQRGGGPDPGP